MNFTKQLEAGVKRFEGLRLTAYKCPAGVWTIGYGHTGASVRQGLTITEQVADELLRADLEKFAREVNALKLPLTKECQFDAVVDFCYNLGTGKFKSSTLYKKILKNPKDTSIPSEFLLWVNAGGKKLDGLVNRRVWDAARWLGYI